MLKISNKHRPFLDFVDTIYWRPTRYLRLNEGVSADGLQEAIEAGKYEVVDDNDLARELDARRNPPTAKILRFNRDRDCEGDLY